MAEHPILPTRDFLAIASLGRARILALLDLAQTYAAFDPRADARRDLLRGRVYASLFFEPSTRTRGSFDLAARRLGADVIALDAAASSFAKGETFADAAAALEAMGVDILVVRHARAGVPAALAETAAFAVVNAGDGGHEHPTQALADALALRARFGKVEGLKVAICGDVARSRVARSNIHLLTALGAEVRLGAPPGLMPVGVETLGARPCASVDEALNGADAVMALRMQHERARRARAPSDADVHRLAGLTPERLREAGARPDAAVLHPGPFNREVEVSSALIDGEHSLARLQARLGVSVRMAVLDAVSRGAP